MTFNESIKENVKRRADFTCCWCRERDRRTEVHHIVPQAKGGLDDEDNAAPLCASCHSLLGSNPELRKAIRSRREHLYETVSRKLNPEYGWPIGLDVPLLSFTRSVSPKQGLPREGIQFTDKDPAEPNNPPLLYLSIYFKRSRYFADYELPGNEKWLYLEANMRFAFNLRIQVRANTDLDTRRLMAFLTGDKKYLPPYVSNADADVVEQLLRNCRSGWSLSGPAPDYSQRARGDYFQVWRESQENRLMIATHTPSLAGISVHARFSDEVATALADYLERAGFCEES